MTDSDPDPDVWDWGVLLDREGNVIPPGSCEGMYGKDKQRDVLK